MDSRSCVLISVQKNHYLHQYFSLVVQYKYLNILKTRFINLTIYSGVPQTDGEIRL